MAKEKSEEKSAVKKAAGINRGKADGSVSPSKLKPDNRKSRTVQVRL